MMQEFIAKSNKLANRILTASQPTAANLKCFFINTQLPKVSFLLRRAAPTTLALAQTLAIEIEDDMILARKIHKDSNQFKNNSFSESSLSGSTNPLVQKLANALLALKKQISQGSSIAPYIYQGGHILMLQITTKLRIRTSFLLL